MESEISDTSKTTDRPHIVDGQFQSDKYPTCPPGKVPLSVKDPMAQDLLWEYARRRREIDSEFADDLEWALRQAGYNGMSDNKTTLPYTARLDAAGWWDKHKSHVDKLVASRDGRGETYPPTGSDRFHPELWKAGHWRWFKQEYLHGR